MSRPRFTVPGMVPQGSEKDVLQARLKLRADLSSEISDDASPAGTLKRSGGSAVSVLSTGSEDSSTPSGTLTATKSRLQLVNAVDDPSAVLIATGADVDRAPLLSLSHTRSVSKPKLVSRTGSEQDVARTGPSPQEAFFAHAAPLPRLTAKQHQQLSKVLSEATRFTAREADYLARLFVSESTTHDLNGFLSFEGLRRCLRCFAMAEPLVNTLFGGFDTRDSSNTIDIREFSQAMGVFLKGSFDEKLSFMFSVWDTDHNGVLARSEVRRMLLALSDEGRALEKDIETLFERLDLDKSGDISYDEFCVGVARIPVLNVMFQKQFAEVRSPLDADTTEEKS